MSKMVEEHFTLHPHDFPFHGAMQARAFVIISDLMEKYANRSGPARYEGHTTRFLPSDDTVHFTVYIRVPETPPAPWAKTKARWLRHA